MFRLILLCCVSLGLSACMIQPVKPWERDILAQESMRPDGYPLIKHVDEHIYFSREAASGGQGVGGGGCGCN